MKQSRPDAQPASNLPLDPPEGPIGPKGDAIDAPRRGGDAAEPLQLDEAAFNHLILPHLSMPRRGPACKIGYHRLFNYILFGLSTGARWRDLPIQPKENGEPEIHFTTVFRTFNRWLKDGSLHAALRHAQEAAPPGSRLSPALLKKGAPSDSPA